MTGKQFTAAIAKLDVLCTRWGGDLTHIDNTIPHELVAPFTDLVGCDWDDMRVVFRHPRSWRKYPFAIAAIIHEMGHVFASEVPPDAADEIAFLGWEMAIATQVGLPIEEWQRAQVAYELEDGGGVYRLDHLNSVNLIKRLAPLLQPPYISDEGEPVAIRQRHTSNDIPKPQTPLSGS